MIDNLQGANLQEPSLLVLALWLTCCSAFKTNPELPTLVNLEIVFGQAKLTDKVVFTHHLNGRVVD